MEQHNVKFQRYTRVSGITMHSIEWDPCNTHTVAVSTQVY